MKKRDRSWPEKIRSLLPCIQREVGRKDTVHPLFHGSWDWHSAVHGHWALLEGGRILEDRELVAWTLGRMGEDRIGGEFSYLEENPAFEMPYGRAWFLLLMKTYEELSGDFRYRERVGAVAGGIQKHLIEVGTAPRQGEYQNSSWALIQLHGWASHAGDVDLEKWVVSQVRESFLLPVADLSRDRGAEGEFFSLWALQAHLLFSVLGADELKKWLGAQEIGEKDLSVVEEHNSVHHLAINASRAWGIQAAYHATGEDRWQQAFDEHVEASLSLHHDWEGHRHAYAHWVPQFTLYALRGQPE